MLSWQWQIGSNMQTNTHSSSCDNETMFPIFVFAASSVRSLSNGWTPSSSSEEEEQGSLKNADSSSAKSDDVKSEVGARKWLGLSFQCLQTNLPMYCIAFIHHRFQQIVLPPDK